MQMCLYTMYMLHVIAIRLVKIVTGTGAYNNAHNGLGY